MALRPARDEAGSTLVELLVTLVILGIAFVTLLGGMFTAVNSSDRQRKQTVADSALRSFAEAVKAAPYDATCQGYETKYTAPAGFVRVLVTPAPCQAMAPGLQLLMLEVRSNDGRATERLEILKRDPG